MSKKDSIHIQAGGDIGNISGVVSGDINGVVNLGQISRNVTNIINQLAQHSCESHINLRELLRQLQLLIETNTELYDEDKIEALEQIKILAQTTQETDQDASQKTARTAIKILQGTIVSLSESSTAYKETNRLLAEIKKEITNNQATDRTRTNNKPIDNKIKTILLLTANPKNTPALRLGEEARELQRGLERSSHRDYFNIQQRWAVTPTEIHRALLDIKPEIVHFSGHGMGEESIKPQLDEHLRSLDIDTNASQKPEGLIFENESGQSQLITSEALASLFKLFSKHITCIVLNACYSENQANAISQYIPYVIGMKRAVGDQAAIKFSTGFYDALLAGESVEFAYGLGCNAIQMAGINEQLTPILKKNRDLVQQLNQ